MSAVRNWFVTIYHAEMSFGIEEKVLLILPLYNINYDINYIK